MVCYGEIGCFEDTGPFGYIDMLPSSPEEISTRFLLYSGRSRGDIPLLDIPFSNMSHVWTWAAKAFNSSAPTKIIVHGFGSSCSHVWVYEMRSALMSVVSCWGVWKMIAREPEDKWKKKKTKDEEWLAINDNRCNFEILICCHTRVS